MKKFKDIAIIIFALSLSILLLSCGEKTTEPKETKVAPRAAGEIIKQTVYQMMRE